LEQEVACLLAASAQRTLPLPIALTFTWVLASELDTQPSAWCSSGSPTVRLSRLEIAAKLNRIIPAEPGTQCLSNCVC